MKKFLSLLILLSLCSVVAADMRQITCAATTTPMSLAKPRRNLYVKNIHGFAVAVTVCLASTCTTGTGVTLSQFQDYENRFYQGPVSCIGTNTITLIVED